MFKSLFGRQEEGTGEGLQDSGEVWALPDMEAATPEPRPEPRTAPHFRFEEAALHPEGVFTAELVGCRPLEGGRAAWLFRLVSDSDYDAHDPEPLPYVTGTTCRADNNLACLMAALGVVPDGRGAGGDPSGVAALRETVEELNPETLFGRRCRIRIEHVRDELGDATATIAEVGGR